MLSLAILILYAGQGALLAFYKRFLESPNFTAWFERQREAAWAWQEAEWTAAAAIRGEGADLSGLDEVQVGLQAWVQHDQVSLGVLPRTLGQGASALHGDSDREGPRCSFCRIVCLKHFLDCR